VKPDQTSYLTADGELGMRQAAGMMVALSVYESLTDRIRQSLRRIYESMNAVDTADPSARAKAIWDYFVSDGRVRWAHESGVREELSSALKQLEELDGRGTIVGDCDCINLLLAPHFLAAGVPVRTVLSALRGSAPDRLAHAYLEVMVNGEWVAIDACDPKRRAFGSAHPQTEGQRQVRVSFPDDVTQLPGAEIVLAALGTGREEEAIQQALDQVASSFGLRKATFDQVQPLRMGQWEAAAAMLGAGGGEEAEAGAAPGGGGPVVVTPSTPSTPSTAPVGGAGGVAGGVTGGPPGAGPVVADQAKVITFPPGDGDRFGQVAFALAIADQNARIRDLECMRGPNYVPTPPELAWIRLGPRYRMSGPGDNRAPDARDFLPEKCIDCPNADACPSRLGQFEAVTEALKKLPGVLTEEAIQTGLAYLEQVIGPTVAAPTPVMPTPAIPAAPSMPVTVPAAPAPVAMRPSVPGAPEAAAPSGAVVVDQSKTILGGRFLFPAAAACLGF